MALLMEILPFSPIEAHRKASRVRGLGIRSTRVADQERRFLLPVHHHHRIERRIEQLRRVLPSRSPRFSIDHPFSDLRWGEIAEEIRSFIVAGPIGAGQVARREYPIKLRCTWTRLRLTGERS